MRRSTEGFLVAVRLFKKIWGNSALKLPSEIAVLICLADHANDENKCWPSIERIASFTKLSVRTVQTTISELEKIGFLIIKRGGGKHFTNIYTINVTPQPLHPRNHCTPATIADEPRNHCTPNPATAVPSVAPEPSGTVRGTVREASNNGEFDSEASIPGNVEAIWFAYPRKVAKKDGLKAIMKAMKKCSFPDLLKKTKDYALRVNGTEQRFIPHPATWFNGERFNDVLEKENDMNPFRVKSHANSNDQRTTAIQDA